MIIEINRFRISDMKRNDAKMIYDIPSYNKIFPYMMRRRCDALVYHTYELDVTKTVEYIRAYNATKPELRLKFFYVFCAALMRTFVMRPELNRFIASYRYWQRDELSMNFVVKENFTDEAAETSNPLFFKPEMTLMEYAKIIDDYITEGRKHNDEDNFTDKAIKFFMHFPVWFIALVIKIARLLDKRGNAPAALREADGLHTSVFVANLGSIGIVGGSPHHHLYEWGTTSVFVTMGMLERKREFDDNGKVISTKETIQIGCTVDERISSGFYFIKSMGYLQDLLNNPAELEKVPDIPPGPLTKKEYKAKLKAEKKAKKEALAKKIAEAKESEQSSKTE